MEGVTGQGAWGAAPEELEEMLSWALESLAEVVPYDLAAVLDLEQGLLRVRAARGRLASEGVRRHTLRLREHPSIRRALETRRPVLLLEEHHEGGEGDPYEGVVELPAGHSCMVVPLFAAGQDLGVMTFDRARCEPYAAETTALAGVYGQLVALALLLAREARALAAARAALEAENRTLKARLESQDDPGAALERSQSPAMRMLVETARQVARADVPVLIQGETGTGKEVLARALHAWSARRDKPLVVVNCAALPEGVLESELFGHKKGAFSGASADRAGRFVAAHTGTLLLDEIGELSLGAQARLLRVLQEGRFEPVGADQSVQVDVRVLAATHVDLARAVAEGRFREDLYYRVGVFPLRLPPLRQRAEDILPLAQEHLEALARRTGRGPWTLSEASRRRLLGWRWPGNVRELLNALDRATVLTSAGALELDPGAQAAPALPAAQPEGAQEPVWTLEEAQRRHVARVLALCGGKVSGPGGAAQRLGVKPTTLHSLMKRLGISRG